MRVEEDIFHWKCCNWFKIEKVYSQSPLYVSYVENQFSSRAGMAIKKGEKGRRVFRSFCHKTMDHYTERSSLI